MPSWSTTVASEFLVHALRDGDVVDQSRLQNIVYIAHGLNLAITGQPLTGDRPEAWSFGPVYRRLADALRGAGNDALTIGHLDQLRRLESSELDKSERDFIARVHQDYRSLSNAQLSYLTQRGETPWAQVFAGGQGEWRDISHTQIKDQFIDFASKSENSKRGL